MGLQFIVERLTEKVIIFAKPNKTTNEQRQISQDNCSRSAIIMNNISGSYSSVLSILSFILLFGNSVFSTNEVLSELDENEVPSLLDPMYLYYLDGSQDYAE